MENKYLHQCVVLVFFLYFCVFSRINASDPEVGYGLGGVAPRVLSPYYLGYNTGHYEAVSTAWIDPLFQTALINQYPGTLRYPGGTPSSVYNWQTSLVMPNNLLPASIFPYMLTVPNRLEDFQQAIAKTRAIPIFVVNMLTSTLESQIQMLEHAQSLGLPITHIELGNEFYLKYPDYENKFPTGTAYALEVNRWTASLKSHFPGVRIAAIAAPRVDYFPNAPVIDTRRDTWNSQVFSTMTGIDAVTFHPYNVTSINPTNTLLAADIEKMLGIPFSHMADMRAHELTQVPAGIDIWFTEFNHLDTYAPVQGTWANGLFNALQTLTFLEYPSISHISFMDILGDAGDSPLFGSTNAFYDRYYSFKTPSPLPPTTLYGRSASGMALSLVGKAVLGMTSAQQFQFSPNPTLIGGPSNTPYPTFYGYRFTDGNKFAGVLLNLSSVSYSLNIGTATPSMYEQMFANPAQFVSNDSQVTYRKAIYPRTFIPLPAYSVTVIGRDDSVKYADTNGDGVVDGRDYILWLNGFGQTTTVSDYQIWKQYYGK